MRGITKRFPGVLALDRVDLTVGRGEVHLLLGENGAGKSTLMKILSGACPKDDGEIRLDGRSIEIRSPFHARTLGISMIYQELNLVPNLTVAENIFLGREPSRAGFVLRARMEEAARKLLRRMRADIAPGALAKDLPVAQQQLVEICRALSLDAKVIVMDEPTSPLTGRETSALFRLIRALKASGVSVIYITHRLEEARLVGDTVTVLRDGRRVGGAPARSLSNARLVRMMVGRTLSQVFPALGRPRPGAVLEVKGLARTGVFGPVSFSLAPGEILGVAGLIGSGRTELARSLIGADPRTAGTISIAGRPVRITSPRDARRVGLCLLPEDRKAQGLVLGLPVVQNVSLASLDRLSRFGFLRLRAEARESQRLVDRLRIRTPSLEQLARNLSGGNQQKVVLARWLAVEPRILVFDEPTRGIDVGARFEVYKLITALARQGVGIMLISSDLGEVLGLSHRVAVMRGGLMTAILPRRAATPERVMHHAMGLAKG
jgi:ribose transport system ATP-binding protein